MEGQASIFIRNLPDGTSEEALKKFLSKSIGPVVELHVLWYPEDNTKEFAYCKFSFCEDARAALANKLTYEDHDLMISECHLGSPCVALSAARKYCLDPSVENAPKRWRAMLTIVPDEVQFYEMKFYENVTTEVFGNEENAEEPKSDEDAEDTKAEPEPEVEKKEGEAEAEPEPEKKEEEAEAEAEKKEEEAAAEPEKKESEEEPNAEPTLLVEQ